MDINTAEEDPKKLLRLCHKESVKIKSSTIPTIIYYGMGLVGWYVAPLARFIVQLNNAPVLLSSFPSGLETLSAFKCNLVETFCIGGTLEGTAGK